jgi:hypothetical protein
MTIPVLRLEDPNTKYESLFNTWIRCRAMIHGEDYVKDHDMMVSDTRNMLIPFSPSMTQEQYNFLKREAELPGVNAQFSKLLVGGLLRKPPQIDYQKDVPQEAKDWISQSISADGNSIIGFLDEALFEEVQTSRAWIYVDYPNIAQEAQDKLTPELKKAIKPYPVIWNAENIINWKVDNVNGNNILSKVVIKGSVERYADPLDVHPMYVDTIWVHELIDNKYQIRVFETSQVTLEPAAIAGVVQTPKKVASPQLVDTIMPKAFGEPLDKIPAWPLNGNIEPVDPLLLPLVDKEIALYNKVTRRNHLLYGASTYTPWIASDMAEADFQKIVNQGLGTWIKLRTGDTLGVLSTPVDALADLDVAIKAALDEISKLGVRMLTPETDQSGVALQLRNASQTAQLGSLNTKISATMSAIIIYLINRRYNLQLMPGDVIFTLSADFDPLPLGADWLRLMTEIYEKNLIPRSSWIALLKGNDLLPSDYDDEEGKKEMNEDELTSPTNPQSTQGQQYAKNVMQMVKQNIGNNPANPNNPVPPAKTA